MDYVKTQVLFHQAKDGDGDAMERLYGRIIPRLQRFAQGRVPRAARRISDTQEVVQEIVCKSLDRMEDFVPQNEGALMRYLRKAVMNRIRDLGRRKVRDQGLDESPAVCSPELSPVEAAAGKETYQLYEQAREELPDDQKQAVTMHIELGYNHHELGKALDRSSEAARKVLARGLKNLASRMQQAKA